MGTELDKLEALRVELLRALEAIEQAEKLAPVGLATQWCALAKVRAAQALEITEGMTK